MHSRYSSAPNEYQLPADVVGGLQGRRLTVLGQLTPNRLQSEQINQTMRPDTNGRSYQHLPITTEIGSSGYTFDWPRVTMTPNKRVEVKALGGRLERHKTSQSTKDLGSLLNSRDIFAHILLRSSDENIVDFAQ